MSWLGRRGQDQARHRNSHGALLTRIEDVAPTAGSPAAGEIDAVVVPTNRPSSYLTEAVALARELSCPILVLCSGESRSAAVGPLFGTTAGAAITVSSTPRHPLLALRTQRELSFLAQPYLDTGNKRNIALLLGRLLGWQRVLFLDDGIRGLSAARVRAATVASAAMPVIGWKFREFPDNSVACHARRSSGQTQDVFIGAGALLVDLSGWVPFFPAVYNEDWLFWHGSADQGRLGVAGEVRQVGFDPFDDPHRAEQQEFGDVLAEGLYELIHQGRSVLVGCLPGYWHGVLEGRREMLEGIDRRLWHLRRKRTHTRDGYEISRVLRSVAAAREALEQVTALDLAEFTSLWRYDLFCWNARLHRLPSHQRMSEALNWLGLNDFHLVGLD